MRTPVRGNVRITATLESIEENGDCDSLRCYDCNVNFTSERYLLGHLLHHIKQPTVLIRRIQQAPIKLTFKSKSDNKFEIINSPTSTAGYQLTPEYLAGEGQISTETDNSECNTEDSGTFSVENLEEVVENIGNLEEISEENAEGAENAANISFSPNFATLAVGDSPPTSEGFNSNVNSPALTTDGFSSDVSGAVPTPPPESPSPTEYPKIRIKTTGLLKEPLTITEITDDNPNGDYRPAEVIEISNNNDHNDSSNFWTTPCLEDPLKLPDGDRDDSNLLSSFLNNNNDQAKAFGITTTDSEFISLDRLDDRNRNALQVYNPSTSVVATNPLDSLTGLPMQQLAEQVSRLQPSGSGMHQQNVLINIQQFPQAPPPQPPHGYQHPPMYPPHPPHPGMAAQPPPMYQPYQYQPNPMYYPPAPNYPPAPRMPPPPPQMPQPNQQMPQQSMAPQQPMPPPQSPQYRQPMPPRPPPPRQFNQQPQRGPAPRQPMVPRQRAPMIRPRGGMIATAVRGPRPRMQNVNSVQNVNGNQNNHMQGQQRLMKRTSEQIQSLQAKKKRMDVLVPDKNDDADCQVIAVQPKNTDGGLPQIQSVQGGTSDPTDNVMHLSDSITLSVRNPPPRPQSPKKSDAKVVANILATRGITVTATPKPKEKSSPTKDGSQAPSVAINLNSAVSIIPTAKNNAPSNNKPSSDSRLPTVDLTDDTVPDPPRNSPTKQAPLSPQKNGPRGAALPFRCDLCPAQYPTAAGLNKHRQSYHKTGSPCEIGIPLIDLKQPGIVQKLTSLGIYNFIPLPSSTPDGNFALPVVSVNAARNSAVCNLNALGASSILTLGPVRSLPKSQLNNVPSAKQ